MPARKKSVATARRQKAPARKSRTAAASAKTIGMRKTAKPSNPKTLNLALQGGGSHGAFTWGVLDRLVEEERLDIEGISGTSAGAMLAIAYASGHKIPEIVAQSRATRFKDFGNWKLSWLGLASNQKLDAPSRGHRARPRSESATRLERRLYRRGNRSHPRSLAKPGYSCGPAG